jgi:hypothetical protein
VAPVGTPERRCAQFSEILVALLAVGRRLWAYYGVVTVPTRYHRGLIINYLENYLEKCALFPGGMLETAK